MLRLRPRGAIGSAQDFYCGFLIAQRYLEAASSTLAGGFFLGTLRATSSAHSQLFFLWPLMFDRTDI